MGGFVSLGATAADLVNFGQQYHSYRRQDLWSKRGYDISLQSMRIDILNTVREEMRDQVTVIVSSLDNLMVVATLMLSIGFGFVVEGTFPPPEDVHDYSEIETFFLVLYAVLCALSLVFPLACLMLTIAARFEVELCQQDVMGDLQKHLLKALTRDQEIDGVQGSGMSRRSMRDPALDSEVGCCPLTRRSRSSGPGPRTDGHSARPLSRRCSGHLGASPPVSRRSSACLEGFHSQASLPSRHWTPAGGGRAVTIAQEDDRATTLPEQSGHHGPVRRASSGLRRHLNSLFEDDQLGHVVEADVREIAEGLQQKVKYYKWLYDIAQVFLWLGMISAVITCSVLLGLFFRANYPETVWVWRCYSGILLICAIASIVFLIWMRSCMLAQPRKKVLERAPSTREISFNKMAREARLPRSGIEGAWRGYEASACSPEAPPPSSEAGAVATAAGPLRLPPLPAAHLPHGLPPAADASWAGPLAAAPLTADHALTGNSAALPLLAPGSSAPAGTRKAVYHTHQLVLTQPTEHFSTAWRCDGCETKYSVLSDCQRYRCAEGCDFDLCMHCFRAEVPRRDAGAAPPTHPEPAAEIEAAGRETTVAPLIEAPEDQASTGRLSSVSTTQGGVDPSQLSAAIDKLAGQSHRLFRHMEEMFKELAVGMDDVRAAVAESPAAGGATTASGTAAASALAPPASQASGALSKSPIHFRNQLLELAAEYDSVMSQNRKLQQGIWNGTDAHSQQ